MAGVTAIVLGALGAGLIATTLVGIDRPVSRPQVIKDGGAWRIEHTLTLEHVLGVTRNVAGVQVQFDINRKAGILAYRDAVRKEAPAAFTSMTTIPALITFAKPMTAERFVVVMMAAGTEVKSFQIRIQAGPGQVGFITGAPDGVRKLDPTQVERYMANLPGYRIDALMGVIATEALVAQEGYDILAQNTQEVFLVDVMRAVAHSELIRIGIIDMPMERIQVTTPYWRMEDYALAAN